MRVRDFSEKLERNGIFSLGDMTHEYIDLLSDHEQMVFISEFLVEEWLKLLSDYREFMDMKVGDSKKIDYLGLGFMDVCLRSGSEGRKQNLSFVNGHVELMVDFLNLSDDDQISNLDLMRPISMFHMNLNYVVKEKLKQNFESLDVKYLNDNLQISDELITDIEDLIEKIKEPWEKEYPILKVKTLVKGRVN